MTSYLYQTLKKLVKDKFFTSDKNNPVFTWNDIEFRKLVDLSNKNYDNALKTKLKQKFYIRFS